MPQENFAEAFEFCWGVEVEGVTHYAEGSVVDGEGDSVAVEDFASGSGEADHSESVVVGEADIFVALVDLAEVEAADEEE